MIDAGGASLRARDSRRISSLSLRPGLLDAAEARDDDESGWFDARDVEVHAFVSQSLIETTANDDLASDVSAEADVGKARTIAVR